MCAPASDCGTVNAPHWSSDGRELTFAVQCPKGVVGCGPTTVVVTTPDAWCANCDTPLASQYQDPLGFGSDPTIGASGWETYSSYNGELWATNLAGSGLCSPRVA